MQISSNGAYHNPKKADGFKAYNIANMQDFEYIVKNFDHSPVIFRDGHRHGENFLSCDFLYIDIDSGLSIEEFRQHPDFRGCEYIIYTSRSHKKPKENKKTGEIETCDRFHVLFPVTTINDKAELDTKLCAISTYSFADKNAKDSARFYFGNKDAVFYYNKGSEFSPKPIHESPFIDDDIGEIKPPKKTFDKTQIIKDDKKSLILNGIRQSITNGFIREYQEYINLGMALKADGYSFQDWQMLLEHGKPPESTTLQCSKYKWDGFNPHSITGGTLMHMARLADPELLKKQAQKPHIAPQSDSKPQTSETTPEGGREPKIRHISAMFSREPDWLIDNYIERKSYALIFGESGTYKSFCAMDWAFCVAGGFDWCGYKVKQGPVLYMFGEGGSGIKRRFDALGKKYGVSPNDLPIYYDDDPPAITDLAEVIERINDILQDMPQPPAAIFIDTLNTAFGGGDENSTADMTAFNAGCTKLISKCQAAVIVIHHSGLANGDRHRGSAALHGKLDHEYKCVKRELEMTFSCCKMKDGAKPEPIGFEFEQVEIARNGIISITSGILKHIQVKAQRSINYTENQRKIVDILREAPGGTGIVGIAVRLHNGAHTKQQDEAIRLTLNRLILAGKVEKTARGVYVINKNYEFED